MRWSYPIADSAAATVGTNEANDWPRRATYNLLELMKQMIDLDMLKPIGLE